MTIERNKELVERHPYLLPRNVWTDEVAEDYDYSYINGIGEIPQGWNKLFLQMCEDIREPLTEAGYLEKFRFTEIKEKYGAMCCYHSGAPEKVCEIISKYEHISKYVCTCCGRPATYETSEYIASFCDDCWKDYTRHEKGEFIKFKPYYKVTCISQGNSEEKIILFEDEWNRYMSTIKC